MNILSVTQLNKIVKMHLDSADEFKNIYVTGEISDVKFYPTSGYTYFKLKDEKSTVAAVLPRFYAQNIQFKLENGIKIICLCSVTLYEPSGTYQVQVINAQPDGIGSLSLAYEQLKKKLEAEGLFDQSKKKLIPNFPKRIGVITSPKGAVIRDIITVLNRRYPMATIVFCPASVQGDKAVPELIDGFKRLEENGDVDVIIIGRGGGSLEDLWAFNNEELARLISKSSIPVISAVGHETDFTICDFVADKRAGTPSIAAEIASPNMATLYSFIDESRSRLNKSFSNNIELLSKRIDDFKNRPCLSDPINYITVQQMKMDQMIQSFMMQSRKILDENDKQLQNCISRLDALSPLKVLKRGYAIPTVNESSIISVNDVKIHDDVQLRLSDGSVLCEVKEIKNE